MNLARLLHLLPIVCAALLYLARIRELRAGQTAEKGVIRETFTFRALLVSGTLVVLLALLEYILRHRPFLPAVFIPGLVIAAVSFVIRHRAAVALDRMWSVHIEIRPDHRLVTAGPYRWVRHPIYLAAILELVGAILILNAVYTIAAFFVLFVPSLILRLHVEERAMIAQLGPAYLNYRHTTPALFPWRFPARKPCPSPNAGLS